MINSILKECLSGKRMHPEQAEELLSCGDWRAVVRAGNEKRNRMHHPQKVSYTGFRIINYTNRCSIKCSFCSFHERMKGRTGYTLSLDELRHAHEDWLPGYMAGT